MHDQDHHIHDDSETDAEHGSIDEIDFVAPRETLARTRPARKSMEPGVVRSLGVAMIVGAILGVAIFYFKPLPRGASASPIARPADRTVSPRPAPAKMDLFELPEWNETDSPKPR